MKTYPIILLLTASSPVFAQSSESEQSSQGSTNDTAPASPEASQVGVQKSGRPAAGDDDNQDAAAALGNNFVPAAKRDVGVTLLVEHGMGSGSLLRNATVRSGHDYVYQTWDIRPFVRFDLWGHKLMAMGRMAFNVELTTPNTNPARRVDPFDAQIRLQDPSLYHNALTDITISGQARWHLPTSYNSRHVQQRYSAASFVLSASRSFGPLWLSYAVTPAKFFNRHKVQTTYADVVRPGDPRFGTGGDVSDPVQLGRGYANTSFSVSNSVFASVDMGASLSFQYMFMLTHAFGYDIVPDNDPYTISPLADTGRGRQDTMFSMLAATYDVSGALSGAVDLPVGVMASLGVSAQHAAQRLNNDIYWPLIVNAFGKSQAANNFGTVFLALAATY